MIQNGPELIDISKSLEHPSSRPDVNESIETLRQIQLYNAKLPKRRRAKDSLSEISVQNVTKFLTQKRDRKKKTLSLVTTYKKVGIVDGCDRTQFSSDPFSLANKQIEIQRSASHLRIRSLRKTYDSLIKLTPPKDPQKGEPEEPKILQESIREVDNPFTEDNLASAISLSVYNRP